MCWSEKQVKLWREESNPCDMWLFARQYTFACMLVWVLYVALKRSEVESLCLKSSHIIGIHLFVGSSNDLMYLFYQIYANIA